MHSTLNDFNDGRKASKFMNIKNRINIDLKNIKKDCLLEEGKSAKFEKWFAKQSEKTDYWFKRNDFVE